MGPPRRMPTMTTSQESMLGDTVMTVAPALGCQQCAVPHLALELVLLVSSHSTSGASPTPAAPPSMETPHPGAQPRLMPTTTMSPELVPGDTAMPLALLLKGLERLDLVLDQPLDPALGPPALPLTALLRDLPVRSPSTSWESSTSAAPPSMETPHPGVQPRLMPTTTMFPELVPGDTVMH